MYVCACVYTLKWRPGHSSRAMWLVYHWFGSQRFPSSHLPRATTGLFIFSPTGVWRIEFSDLCLFGKHFTNWPVSVASEVCRMCAKNSWVCSESNEKQCRRAEGRHHCSIIEVITKLTSTLGVRRKDKPSISFWERYTWANPKGSAWSSVSTILTTLRTCLNYRLMN